MGQHGSGKKVNGVTLIILLAVVWIVTAGDALAVRPLFVSDSTNVKQYDGTTGAFIKTFVAAGTGGLSGPMGLAFGPDRNLYVSSFNTNNVLKYDGATGAFIGAFVSAGSGGLSGPIGLTFGPDNNLYVIQYNGNKVLRYNGTTGAFMDEFVPQNFTLSAPIDLAFSPAGDLYVTNNGTNPGSVSKFTGAGVFQGVAPIPLHAPVPPATDPFNVHPYGITFGPTGDYFISGYESGAAIEFSVAGGAVNYVGDFATDISLPYGLAFGPDGNLYAAAYGAGKVMRFNGTTGLLIGDFVAAGSGGLSNPTFLTFAPPAYYQIHEGTTGSGTTACTPDPVAETTSSTCVITPNLNNHTVDVAAGPNGLTPISVGPLWVYRFVNVTEEMQLQASFASNHFWFYKSGQPDGTGSTTITAALTQAAVAGDDEIRVENGAYFEGFGLICSSDFGTVQPRLSGGWANASARGGVPTLIAPKLTISGSCSMEIDQITMQ